MDSCIQLIPSFTFEGVESVLDDLDEHDFEVVEAVLYIRVETPIIDGGEINALGIQTIVPNAPLFLENEATWNGPYSDNEWFDPGTAAVASSAYDYTDMLMLPEPYTDEVQRHRPHAS